MENLSLYFTAASEYRNAPLESTYTNLKGTSLPRSFSNEKKNILCVVPLVVGGENKLVTDKNKSEYLQLMVHHCTAGRFGLQAAAVREGILSVLPEPCLSLFNDRELDLLVSGCASVDLKDWRAHTVSGGREN